MLDDRKNVNIGLNELLLRFLYLNRNSIHSTTGKTPYSLIFGRQLDLPWKMLTPNPEKVIVEENIPKIKRKTFKFQC